MWEIFQLFIPRAQESPTLCHRVALRAAVNTTPAQIRLTAAHNVTADATSPDYRKPGVGDVIGPERQACRRVMLLFVSTGLPSWSHPIHSKPRESLTTAPQLVSDAVVSTLVTSPVSSSGCTGEETVS